jgi:hemoglobin-like flavoprotein
VDERVIEVYNDSLERCMARPEFLHRFYELFIRSSDEVAEKFKNTDMKKQERVLKYSLYTLLLAVGGGESGRAELERLAEVHNRKNRDIKPHLYDLWLDCLLQAVREYDGAYGPEVERSWRQILGTGINHLKERY